MAACAINALLDGIYSRIYRTRVMVLDLRVVNNTSGQVDRAEGFMDCVALY